MENYKKESILSRIQHQHSIESKRMNISLHDLELFICDLSKLYLLPFEKVPKKSLFMPFNLSFNFNERLTINHKS